MHRFFRGRIIVTESRAIEGKTFPAYLIDSSDHHM
jgi:hypothetical protein